MASDSGASVSGYSLGVPVPNSTYVSKSPWFLTINPDNKDVLVWKRGVRLRGSDARSVGPVKGIKVNQKDNSIEVSLFLYSLYYI